MGGQPEHGRAPAFISAAFIAFGLGAYATFETMVSDGRAALPPAGYLTIILLVLHVTPLLALQHRYRGVRFWQAFVASALLGAACMLFPYHVPHTTSWIDVLLGFGFTPVATLAVYEVLQRTRLATDASAPRAEGVAPRG